MKYYGFTYNGPPPHFTRHHDGLIRGGGVLVLDASGVSNGVTLVVKVPTDSRELIRLSVGVVLGS